MRTKTKILASFLALFLLVIVPRLVGGTTPPDEVETTVEGSSA